jgi:hypothetical protein
MLAFKNKRNNLPMRSALDKTDIMPSLHDSVLQRNNSSLRNKQGISKEKPNMTGVQKDNFEGGNNMTKQPNEGKAHNITTGYPDNYAYYLSKSSVFGKVGNSILNIKKHNYNNNSHIGEGTLKRKNDPLTSGGTDNIINELITNMNNNFNMEMNSKIMEDKGVSSEAAFMGDKSMLERHSTLWDHLLELESNVENKIYIKNLARKILTSLSDELNTCPSFFDVFLLNNLNRAYSKCFKIVGILLIYLTFLVTDFNYENNVKQNIKRIIVGINEFLIWMIETYILSTEESKVNSSFVDKFKKISKQHRARKGRDVINIVIKNLDTVVNTMRQFAK